MSKTGVALGALIVVAGTSIPPVLAADARSEIAAQWKTCADSATLDELMKCYDTSGDFIIYDLTTPREFDGVEAVRANFAMAFENKNTKIEVLKQHVVSDGKMGFAATIAHMTAIDKNGAPVDQIWRVTDAWKKEKGGWKMLHQHFSFPMDPATGKADIQSKP